MHGWASVMGAESPAYMAAVHEMSTHCAVLAPGPQNTENWEASEVRRYLPGSSGDHADEALDKRLQVLQDGPSVKFMRHSALQLRSCACKTNRDLE